MTQFYVGTLDIRLGKLFRFDAEELRVIKSSYSIMYSHINPVPLPRHWVEALQFLLVRVLETMLFFGYEGTALQMSQ